MIKVQIPEKLVRLVTTPKPLKIMVGGRGSGKSETAAQCMLKLCDDGRRILCVREFQNSIDDSVHSLLKRKIEQLGITSLTPTATTIQGLRSEIIYKGLARNVQSIKSLDNIGAVWIEEGQTLSQESIDTLFPTIRNKDAEIWVTMNRGSVNDPIATSFLYLAELELERCGYYEDDYMIVVEINWRDNPFFPETLNQQRLKNFKEWPRAKYDHIWEGGYGDTVPAAIIEPDWFDACIDAHIKLGFEPKGQEKMAYDPADCGDAKAIAYIHGSVLIGCSSTTEGLIDTATDWALGKCNQLKPDVFLWDCDGIGAGLKDQVLKALNGKKIKPVMFKGSMAAQDDEQWTYSELEDIEPEDRFSNQRAQCYWRLRERMIKTYKAVVLKQYCDPDELISFSSSIAELKGLRSELCRIPRKPNSAGRIQLVSKADMLKPPYRLKSPNLADAVMMLMKTVDMYESDDDYYEPVRRGTWA